MQNIILKPSWLEPNRLLVRRSIPAFRLRDNSVHLHVQIDIAH